MNLTLREKSDIEVLQRLFGIEYIFYENRGQTFIAKQKLGHFLQIKPEYFPSLKKKSYEVSKLLSEN